MPKETKEILQRKLKLVLKLITSNQINLDMIIKQDIKNDPKIVNRKIVYSLLETIINELGETNKYNLINQYEINDYFSKIMKFEKQDLQLNKFIVNNSGIIAFNNFLSDCCDKVYNELKNDDSLDKYIEQFLELHNNYKEEVDKLSKVPLNKEQFVEKFNEYTNNLNNKDLPEHIKLSTTTAINEAKSKFIENVKESGTLKVNDKINIISKLLENNKKYTEIIKGAFTVSCDNLSLKNSKMIYTIVYDNFDNPTKIIPELNKYVEENKLNKQSYEDFIEKTFESLNKNINKNNDREFYDLFIDYVNSIDNHPELIPDGDELLNIEEYKDRNNYIDTNLKIHLSPSNIEMSKNKKDAFEFFQKNLFDYDPTVLYKIDKINKDISEERNVEYNGLFQKNNNAIDINNLSTNELLEEASKKNKSLISKDYQTNYFSWMNKLDKTGFYDKKQSNTFESIIEKFNGKILSSFKDYDINIIDTQKFYQNSINTIDNIIKGLKENNDGHFFNYEKLDFEKKIYPGKYRLDAEGISLVNSMCKVMDFANKYKLSYENIVKNPIDILANKYDDNLKNVIMQFKNGGSICEQIMNLEKSNIEVSSLLPNLEGFTKDLKDMITELYKGSNSNNKIEAINFLTNKINTYTRINQINSDIIKNILSNKKNKMNFYVNKLVADKDANVYKLLSTDENKLIDTDKKELIEPFNPIEYIKNRDFTYIFEHIKSVYKQRDYEDKTNNILDEAIEGFNKKIGLGIETKLIENSITIDTRCQNYLNALKEGKKPTPIQLNTLFRGADFAETINKDFTKDALSDENKDGAYKLEMAINTISSLRKEYYSHNPLARLFYTNLNAQNDTIKQMRESIYKLGITKNQLDDYFKIFESHDVSKDGRCTSMVKGFIQQIKASVANDKNNNPVVDNKIENKNEIDENSLENEKIQKQVEKDVNNKKIEEKNVKNNENQLEFKQSKEADERSK